MLQAISKWGGLSCLFSWIKWLVILSFPFILRHKECLSVSFFSTSHALMLLSVFWLLGTLEYPGVGHPLLRSEGEHDFVGFCSDEVSGVYRRDRGVLHCWSAVGQSAAVWPLGPWMSPSVGPGISQWGQWHAGFSEVLVAEFKARFCGGIAVELSL